MGTVVSLDLRGPVAEDDLRTALALLHRADEVFSTYRPDSAVSRLDRGELTVAQCPAEVAEVLEACERARVRTRGWFDARAADALDPSGLVKGWALQRASDLLVERGCTVHSINGGGDVLSRGRPVERAWRTGVADPRRAGRLLAVVEGGDLAVATSGTAERGAHVLDPHTGRPVTELLSVTVVAPSLVDADVSATAALAMGHLAMEQGALAWPAGSAECAALVVAADGAVRTTPAWSAVAGPA